LAVASVAQALVAMNGQFFVTGSCVPVQRGIADTVRAALIAACGAIRIDTSEDPLTDRFKAADALQQLCTDQFCEEIAVIFGAVETESHRG
jgi:acyl-CoA reductase-like NAD-dependent aldehyde dehydrogenase